MLKPWMKWSLIGLFLVAMCIIQFVPANAGNETSAMIPDDAHELSCVKEDA